MAGGECNEKPKKYYAVEIPRRGRYTRAEFIRLGVPEEYLVCISPEDMGPDMQPLAYGLDQGWWVVFDKEDPMFYTFKSQTEFEEKFQLIP